MTAIAELKSRIFGLEIEEEEIFTNKPQFELEEILESITKEEETDFLVFKPLEKKVIEEVEAQSLIVEVKEETSRILLYELADNLYYVYTKAKQSIYFNSIKVSPKIPKDPNLQHNYGLFVPSGVVVRRVPQNILGTGVLGRAFLGQDYIEILDSLSGNAYQEVLTHEILHILHPEKKEREIRDMTRNYIGHKNTIYH